MQYLVLYRGDGGIASPEYHNHFYVGGVDAEFCKSFVYGIFSL